MKQKIEFQSANISKILINNYSNLMSEFFEMQSQFLSLRYKAHGNLETSSIIICFIRNVHLSIVRQREKNLDYNISLDNFLKNLKKIDSPKQKIISIVNETGIPKETVRRKIINLVEKEYIFSNKNREYYWDLASKHENNFIKIIENDVDMITKFIHNITKYVNINLNEKIIKNEIRKQFSFYFYHFLSCQLLWFKMWQHKIKDIDLILITLQALIPTLQYLDKNLNYKNLSMENFYTVVGKANEKYRFSDSAVSASSISDITGIPRATCIRKLEKLTKLGGLIQDKKTKRYYVNQLTPIRTKNIITQENINFTIKIFSDFLVIVLNALIRNSK